MTATLTQRAPGHPTGPRPTGNPKVVLAIILATYLMIILDATIVITALPDIHRALHFSSTGLSWVQNAYTLTFGGLLLLGARAGDILGRRRVFVAGIACLHLGLHDGWPGPVGLVAVDRPRRPGRREPPSPHRRPSPFSRSASKRDRRGPGPSAPTAPWPGEGAASGCCSAAC